MLKKSFQSSFFVAVVMLLAWLPASSFAAGVAAPSAFDAFMWTATGGQSQTVGFGSNGMPIATSAPPLVDTDGGLPRVTQSGTLKNPSGNPFTVSAAGRVSAANTAKAVGKALARNLWPVVVGGALYDLFKEMGYEAVRSSDGAVTVTKFDPLVCTVAPCYTYQFRTAASASTPAQACTNGLGLGQSSGYGYVTYTAVVSSNTSGCVFTASNAGASFTTSLLALVRTTVTPAPSNYLPSSEQAFVDAVAAKSGWPSTSAISRVLAEHQSAYDDFLEVNPASLTVTGPATSPGTTTTTNNTTNNTTKTETVTHNHTYDGAKVNTSTVTNTTVINNIDNSVVEQSTKTETPPKADEGITCGLPGTPVCAVKVDETGTPADVAEAKFQPMADKVKTSKDSGLDRMKTPGDTSGMFSGWSAFFGTPAMVACTPIALPQFKGASMGSLDPCPVVDGMREVMAYLWAIGGLFLCLGMIRQTVQGG